MQIFSHFRRALPAAGLLLAGAGLLCRSKEASDAAVAAAKLCGRSLLPSLFPFFVLSSLMISTGAADLLSAILGKGFRRMFRLPACCVTPFLLGLLGGYPVGARSCAALCQSGRITYGEARRLLLFCNNCGPAFLISAVGSGMLHQTRSGAVLYVCHLAGAILIGFITREKTTYEKEYTFTQIQSENGFLSCLISAVSDAVYAFLNVCAYVILFGITVAVLQAVPGFGESAVSTLLLGNLEMTCGISRACGHLKEVRLLYPVISFFAGWGGVSVQMQSASVLKASGLPLKSYLLAKIAHGALSAFLAWMAAAVIPAA